MENINYVHNIIAPKFSGFVAPIILMVLFIALFLCCVGIVYYMKNTSIIIANESLTIESLFYGKAIPFEKINVRGLRQLNLYNDKEYDVKIRINGIGLPYYYVGWMKLNNGNKSLVYLTDRANVALIPTDEYDILFSTDDFDGIKDKLSKRE